MPDVTHVLTVRLTLEEVQAVLFATGRLARKDYQNEDLAAAGQAVFETLGAHIPSASED